MLWKMAAVLGIACGWFCLVGDTSDATMLFSSVNAQQHRAGIALESSVCVANAELTSARNILHPAQPLDTTAQYYLRPWFGDLVDKVRLTWNARLNDHLGFANGILTQGSRAQTYGYQVYIAASQGARDPESPQQLLLLAHELVHTAQYVRYGENLAHFCHEYMQGWAQSRGVYKQNPLEHEAFDTAFAFAQWLGQQVPAASQTDSMIYLHGGDRQPARQTRIPRRLPRVDTDRQRPLRQSSRRETKLDLVPRMT